MPAFKQAIKTALKPALSPALHWLDFQKLPASAKQASRADHSGSLSAADPGPARAIDAGLDWLKRAQDQSKSADGGVARHWSYLSGWAPSYPETTGYIVPTLLEQADIRADPELGARAKRMLNWLVSIQFGNGGFQGGMIGQEPKVPVTFNTGQILLGLAAGAKLWPDRYLEPMRKAANFLSTSQDDDGCWRSQPSPFAAIDDKTYETHVSWGLFEAARIEKNSQWITAATRQVDWAITHQKSNGWMDYCCLSDKTAPISHTLGYALRGFMEAWRFTGHVRFLKAATLLASGLRGRLEEDGRLPGAFRADWSPAIPSSCLTGAVQIAHSWLMLFEDTGEADWLDAGKRANAWARRTIDFEGSETIRGAVKGSYPCDGSYCRFEYPNWATKFLIDSCQLEAELEAA
ncbi:MAG: hypothetical protein AAF221_02580 [Pseudomonadota bacterium]